MQELPTSLSSTWQEFSTYCRSQLSTMSSSADSLKTASKQEACQWLIKAQDYVYTHDHESVQSHWTRPSIDGSEDNLLRNQRLFKVLKLEITISIQNLKMMKTHLRVTHSECIQFSRITDTRKCSYQNCTTNKQLVPVRVRV